ncbi:MAG: efflux RND transporter periplasmic adaptor subunit [Acidobacteriota bacterium]
MFQAFSKANLLLSLIFVLACGGGRGAEEGAQRGGGPPGGRGAWGGGSAVANAAVPVEVAPVVRRAVSAYLETHGTLEAENEVDLVARIGGPLVEVATEEGRRVRRGDLLARIDPDEVRAEREIALVEKNEAELTYQRLQRLYDGGLVSLEQLEQARGRAESARAQLEGREIQLAYTEVRAPFDGLIVRRYVKQAENVGVNTPLFRLSDFDPLLCPIQVPERELSRLREGQPARLEVEAWPGESFAARVLRISPVIAAATGTVEVTLEVTGRGLLRPGMFASVFLETDRRADALVIPFAALALDRLGDSVYVVEGGLAVRQEIDLGFRERDSVEVLNGLTDGDQVVVVGQDGLADGTPVEILSGGGDADPQAQQAQGSDTGQRPATDSAAANDPTTARGERRGPPRSGPRAGEDRDARIEEARQRMRQRGLSEEEIEQRIERFREGAGRRPEAPASSGPAAADEAPRRLPTGDGPPIAERIEQARERMRQRGLSEEEIEQRIERFRNAGEGGGPDAAELERMRRRMAERGLTPEQIEQRLERLRQGGNRRPAPQPPR